MRGRLPPALLVLLLVVAAAAVAVSLNIVLLRRASAGNDPVGRLSPRARLPAAPLWTIRPARARVEDRGADD
jgi:hypothetical protein